MRVYMTAVICFNRYWKVNRLQSNKDADLWIATNVLIIIDRAKYWSILWAKNGLQADEGDTSEHEQDAEDLEPGNAFAGCAKPTEVLHQHAEGELSHKQSH